MPHSVLMFAGGGSLFLNDTVAQQMQGAAQEIHAGPQVEQRELVWLDAMVVDSCEVEEGVHGLLGEGGLELLD
eukprot:1258234-Lingulodinium_polyedra.AAC.1